VLVPTGLRDLAHWSGPLIQETPRCANGKPLGTLACPSALDSPVEPFHRVSRSRRERHPGTPRRARSLEARFEAFHRVSRAADGKPDGTDAEGPRRLRARVPFQADPRAANGKPKGTPPSGQPAAADRTSVPGCFPNGSRPVSPISRAVSRPCASAAPRSAGNRAGRSKRPVRRGYPANTRPFRASSNLADPDFGRAPTLRPSPAAAARTGESLRACSSRARSAYRCGR